MAVGPIGDPLGGGFLGLAHQRLSYLVLSRIRVSRRQPDEADRPRNFSIGRSSTLSTRSDCHRGSERNTALLARGGVGRPARPRSCLGYPRID